MLAMTAMLVMRDHNYPAATVTSLINLLDGGDRCGPLTQWNYRYLTGVDRAACSPGFEIPWVMTVAPLQWRRWQPVDGPDVVAAYRWHLIQLVMDVTVI